VTLLERRLCRDERAFGSSRTGYEPAQGRLKMTAKIHLLAVCSSSRSPPSLTQPAQRTRTRSTRRAGGSATAATSCSLGRAGVCASLRAKFPASRSSCPECLRRAAALCQRLEAREPRVRRPHRRRRARGRCSSRRTSRGPLCSTHGGEPVCGDRRRRPVQAGAVGIVR
jgi:hypothetical protein